MRESVESKVKSKLWIVEEGASERFNEILIEKEDSIDREDLLKYIRSNFEGLRLKNLESLQEITY